MTDRTGDRLFTPAYVLLSVADLGYFTAVGVSVYTLPLYVTGPIGGDRATAGLAFGVFAVSALVLRPFAGRLTDVWGRRPLLVGGALLAALGLVLTAVVDSLALIVALRLLLGVAEAGFIVAGFAALADLAPPARMGEALSYNSLGLYLGLAFGPPLGELLVETSGFTTAWLVAGGISATSALLALGIGETRSAEPVPEGPRKLIHRKAIAPGIGFFTALAAIGGFLTFAALHADAIGMGQASVPLFTYGIVVVVCRVAFAKVSDRFPPLRVGAAALGLMSAGLAVAASWVTPTGLMIGVVLLALGVTFSTPAFFSAIFATASPSERGAASGTASAFIDLGLGGGPILLGLVAQSAGIPWAFAAAAATTLAGAAWTLAQSRRPTLVR
ncbi:Transporter, putative [Alloactinosynnema sp. L-07]|uniref:MFS transporter n=1 Tax=Alloactinosynnema sp. L-07 TaxID=1653480 RepID=UPI00065F003E|nr:MFS transporter [Alloactinosynnema sp. L-07]CRK57388.1 Transporter, putative [Alloactinosynnema sp. L-07]